MKKWVFLLVLGLGQLNVAFALSHSRGYQWDFQYPNLVPNWSFENSMEFWNEEPGGMEVITRLKAAGTGAVSAKSGSFVGVVSGTSPTSATYLTSERFRARPSTAYTLSFYYRTYGSLSSSIYPMVTWFSSVSFGGAGFFPGAALNAASSWTLYTQTFSTPANAEYLSLSLARFPAAASGTVYFDDVILEEGALTPGDVAAHRQQVSQSIAYGDGLGRVLETQQLIDPAANRYLVGGVGHDDFARPETTFMAAPKVLSTPAFQTNLLGDAQAYFNTELTVHAKGFPFSRVKYPSALSGFLEASSPDSAWQIGKGHTVRQDIYFVNDSLVPANIENPPNNPALCKYRLDWAKNEDSTYSLTWTNKLGQVIRKAANITRTAASANTWKWATTRYEYHPNGALKKVYTPLDDSAGTSHFAEVSQSDARGRPLSAYSPDRGLRKFWYNRSGLLRFSQDEEQRAAGEFAYAEYDALGRLSATGIQTGLGSSPAGTCVDRDQCGDGTKIEQIGYIYDDTTTFQARTGFTLLDILGSAKANVDVPKLSHRLFCKYNKNADNILSGFSAKDKFVADFYSYDERGNVKTSWKYTGPVRDTQKRLQDCAYTYDSRNRLTGFTNRVSATESGISASQTYVYDFLGRVSAIQGVGSRYLARYAYADWGPLSRVVLGGLASGDSATNVDYAYHSQGGLRKIQAASKFGVSAPRFYQQFLGYESKAYPVAETPAPLKAKFDGSISQQVYKYATGDAVKPVRLVNYAYDHLGRMERAKGYLNVNDNILDANEDIKPGQAAVYATEDLSTSMNYDLNGRITGQRSGGVSSADSARYVYAPNSYKLDKVTGKLTPDGLRNLSVPGNFTYDLNGAMLRDHSKKVSVAYGWDGLPVSFAVDIATSKGMARCCLFDPDLLPAVFKVKNPVLTSNNFYDADGNRVSRVEAESKANGSMALRSRAAHYVYMGPGMLKEWDEEYHQSGRIKKTSTVVSLLGQSSQIGRIRPDGKYEYFVKNHLGSTVKTVDDRGRYNNGSDKTYDYLAYGTSKLLKTGSDTTDVRQKFTGKELEALTGLHAFGWRWHDAELGMWMSPDPVGEFFNPYSFVGGDPINRVDPDGLSSEDDVDGGDLDERTCTSTPEKNGTCMEDRPELSPVDVAIVVTVIAGGAIVSAGDAIAEGIGSLFGGGGGKKKKEPSPNPQPAGGGATTIYDSGPEADWDEVRRNFYDNFGTDPDTYDINRFGSAGEDWGVLRDDPLFQYSRDFGVPTGRVVGEMVQIAMPMGPIAIPLRAARGTTVAIGKVADLSAPGALRTGERLLELPNLGAPKLNWIQNSSRLREAIRNGERIRDVSAQFDASGKLLNNTGFLRAERNLLINKGFQLDPVTGIWVPY